MAVLLQLITIVLTLLLKSSLTTGKDVINVTDDELCLKGRNCTLTCKLNKRTLILKWMNENDVVPIVHCQEFSCKLNHDFKGQYSYASDPTKNKVNLTVLNVDINYNGKMLVCSNGKYSDCKFLHIADYEQSLDEKENGFITATSACTSDREVSFKWIKIDAGSNKEVEFKPKLLSTTVTNCSTGCGHSIKYSQTITVVPSGKGTKCYLKMAFIYGTVHIESQRTTVGYMVEEQAGNTKHEEDVIVIVIIAFIIAAAIVVVSVILWRKGVLKKNYINCNRAENSKGEKEPFMKSDDRTKHQEGYSNVDKGSDKGVSRSISEKDTMQEWSLPFDNIPRRTKTSTNTRGVEKTDEIVIVTQASSCSELTEKGEAMKMTQTVDGEIRDDNPSVKMVDNVLGPVDSEEKRNVETLKRSLIIPSCLKRKKIYDDSPKTLLPNSTHVMYSGQLVSVLSGQFSDMGSRPVTDNLEKTSDDDISSPISVRFEKTPPKVTENLHATTKNTKVKSDGPGSVQSKHNSKPFRFSSTMSSEQSQSANTRCVEKPSEENWKEIQRTLDSGTKKIHQNCEELRVMERSETNNFSVC